MTFYGGYFYGGSSGGGGGTTPTFTFPALTTATTAEAIRDRVIAVIKSITPDLDSGLAFVPYRNEGGGNFKAWCEAHPAGARRRFQVRDNGAVFTPPISNVGHDERFVELLVTVAYPQTHRDGGDGALDRDDTSDSDKVQIEYQTGYSAKYNFAVSNGHPDATCTEWQCLERDIGIGCDFVDIRIVYRYLRALGA